MASNLSEAARKARNEYQKNWRRSNPEKVAAAANRYWEKKAAKAAESEKK